MTKICVVWLEKNIVFLECWKCVEVVVIEMCVDIFLVSYTHDCVCDLTM